MRKDTPDQQLASTRRSRPHDCRRNPIDDPSGVKKTLALESAYDQASSSFRSRSGRGALDSTFCSLPPFVLDLPEYRSHLMARIPLALDGPERPTRNGLADSDRRQPPHVRLAVDEEMAVASLQPLKAKRVACTRPGACTFRHPITARPALASLLLEHHTRPRPLAPTNPLTLLTPSQQSSTPTPLY